MGIVFVVDRLKEILKVRGFQVAPAELEGHLLGHPFVTDVCVVGAPDEFSGEAPMAFVVPKFGGQTPYQDRSPRGVRGQDHHNQGKFLPLSWSVPRC